MSITYLKIETVHAGQPKRYADSEYTYKVAKCHTFDGTKKNLTKVALTKAQAVSIAKTQYPGNFADDKNTAGFLGAYLQSCSPVEGHIPSDPGTMWKDMPVNVKPETATVWRITIIDPYKD